MIVKNEEAFLGKCLESVQQYVDEIIIVDTGSTDRTVDIAKRFTDKVFFHPWENSFSKARNYSLSYATRDWIFIIDADEELLPESGPLLREAIRNAGSADVLLVNIISLYANGKRAARHNLERICRNNGAIRFEGIVHNQMTGAKEIRPSKVELKHYGYDLSEKKRNEKFLRTAGLLNKAIEEKPDDPLPHHYLGASYLSLGMHDECIRESLLAIELADKQGNTDTAFLCSHYNAAISFLGKGEAEKAGQLASKAAAMFPDHLDSHYILTLVCAEKREWGNVKAHGGKYLELLDLYNTVTEKAGMILNCTLKEAPAVHILLGYAEYHLRNLPGMLGRFAAACRESGHDWEVWTRAANYFIDIFEDLELARDLLGRVKGVSREEREFIYTLAKLNEKSGRPDEERDCLKKICRADSPDNKDIRLLKRIALLCMAAGDYSEALDHLQEAAKLDPADYDVLLNIARVHNKLGRFRQAVEYYSAALEGHGAVSDCEPWIELGDLCLALDRPDEAGLFYSRALEIEPGRMEAILKAGESELLRGRIEDFVRRCDCALKQLGISRDRVINSMDDLAGILLDIDLKLSGNPDLSEMAFRLLRLLPNIDYKKMLIEMKSSPSAQHNEITLKRLESLTY
jgi:glycosyltransferase involved in cell wall biosynthesis